MKIRTAADAKQCSYQKHEIASKGQGDVQACKKSGPSSSSSSNIEVKNM
jgi:hypothetical protein